MSLDLARRSFAGLWAHPVGLFILALGPMGQKYPWQLWLLTGLAVAQAIFRGVAARRVLAEPPQMAPDTFCRISTAMLLGVATMWGLLAMVAIRQFGPSGGPASVAMLIMGGISAGGVLTWAPNPPLMYAYTLIPWSLALAADFSVPHFAWAEASVKVLYTAFLLLQGRRLSIAYTEGLQRERELEQARETAEASSAAKDRFLASMSHEIRTPMNGILGTLALLEQTRLGHDQSELVTLARDSAQGLLGLLNDILDIAKIEAGQMQIEHIEFDLPELCAGALGTFKGSAAGKGLMLEWDWTGPRRERVTGDPTRLRQVLANLIGNAVKFTDRGLVRLAVTRKGDSVRFLVEDSGIGIPKDKQHDVFNAFVQADAATTRRHGGTGLGLAISQEIVRLMGGCITVDSTPGQGSRFSFTLALPVEAAAPEVEEAEPAPTPTPVEELPPLRVLLVEDGTVNQRVVLGMLRLLGHQADLAVNGAEALEAARRQPYDLILMDVQMPVMNGLEATTAIRGLEQQQPQRGRAAIHGLSANAYESDRDRGLAAGMDGYLTKPVGLETLRELLGRVHQTKPPAAGVPAAGGVLRARGFPLTGPGIRS